MKLKLLLAGLMLAMAGTAPAGAAIISKAYEFTASTTGPIRDHQGWFSYVHDTDLNTITLTAFEFTLADVVFSVETVGIEFARDALVIGGLLNGVTQVQTGTTDFFFLIDTGVRNVLSYTLSTTTSQYRGTGTLTEIVPPPASVAEPGALGLIGAGLAGLGLAARRRRKVR